MYYISHRGNLNGPIPEKENSVEYILSAIKKGYQVEVDVWYIDNKWYFGHDEPTYQISNFNQLISSPNKFWFHCKNLEALEKLNHFEIEEDIFPIKYFWHQNDSYTLTSYNYIWTYPGQKLSTNSICVLPENVNYSDDELKNCKGICSDYIENYRLLQ